MVLRSDPVLERVQIFSSNARGRFAFSPVASTTRFSLGQCKGQRGMLRHADVGWLRRAAAELGLRKRDGLTLSRKLAPEAWAKYNRSQSVLESPLLSYRPQEGTPNMMIADVGITAVADLTVPSMRRVDQPLQIGDLVRLTDAVTHSSGFARAITGVISAAARAGTVGVVEGHSASSEVAVVRLTGYYDHPLGLPMVMERADGDSWQRWRKKCGPVQRILPTGELAGPEESLYLTAAGTELAASAPMGTRSARDVDGELARQVPAIEVHPNPYPNPSPKPPPSRCTQPSLPLDLSPHYRGALPPHSPSLPPYSPSPPPHSPSLPPSPPATRCRWRLSREVMALPGSLLARQVRRGGRRWPRCMRRACHTCGGYRRRGVPV